MGTVRQLERGRRRRTTCCALQFVYGAGVENYFNDAPVDVGVKNNPGNAVTPIVGEALKDLGIVLYLDHNWNSTWSTAAGYALVDISNSNAQAANAYRKGQYASVNLLSTPAKNVMMGGELQFARRDNYLDGFSSNDIRLQFTFKYNFSVKRREARAMFTKARSRPRQAGLVAAGALAVCASGFDVGGAVGGRSADNGQQRVQPVQGD